MENTEEIYEVDFHLKIELDFFAALGKRYRAIFQKKNRSNLKPRGQMQPLLQPY